MGFSNQSLLRPVATAALLAGLVAGCAGHEHAPAEVPSAVPVTAGGDRFDVVIPGDTPVTILAANQDPDDNTYRAFRYDWVAGGRVLQADTREAREGPVELPATPGRGFLYVDAVHRPAGGGAGGEQKSRLSWKSLGGGVWRLFFKDGTRGTGRRDDLVVTVRFMSRQAMSPAVTGTAAPGPAMAAPEAAATTGTAGNAGGNRAARAAVPAPPSWGEPELGRPVSADACRVCGTTEHLARRVTDNRQWYWVRCNKCDRASVAAPTALAAEAAWNKLNPTGPAPGQDADPTDPPDAAAEAEPDGQKSTTTRDAPTTQDAATAPRTAPTTEPSAAGKSAPAGRPAPAETPADESE